MTNTKEAAKQSIVWFNGLVGLGTKDAFWVHHFKNLRDAYLAEHPIDEDNLVTKDWFSAVELDDEDVQELRKIGNFYNKDLVTCGDFRRLCDGLGIKLEQK